MKLKRYLLIYSPNSSSDLEAQDVLVYAYSWQEALNKALSYEAGFIGLHLNSIRLLANCDE